MSKETKTEQKSDPHIDLMFQQVYAKIADLKEFEAKIEKKIDEILAVVGGKSGIFRELAKQRSGGLKSLDEPR